MLEKIEWLQAVESCLVSVAIVLVIIAIMIAVVTELEGAGYPLAFACAGLAIVLLLASLKVYHDLNKAKEDKLRVCAEEGWTTYIDGISTSSKALLSVKPNQVYDIRFIESDNIVIVDTNRY